MAAENLHPQPDSGIGLPESLRRQFHALEQRLFKVETASALCLALAGILLSWLLFFISDRLWETPVWGRTLLFAAGMGVGACAAGLWIARWVVRKPSSRDLSRLVQRRFPPLGDRLLGIVELADEVRHSPNFSPALYRAAIRQVATETEQFDFTQAVEIRRARRARQAALSLAAVVIALLLFLPAAGLNAFQRWAFPLAGIERLTLVELSGLPEEKIVPHGEPFTLEANVRYRSFWRPASVTSQFERQRRVSSRVLNGAFTLETPGQVTPGEQRLRVGDATRVVRIVPAHRPALRELHANVHYPEYLRRDPAEEPVPSGVLTVVEGSTVAVRGETSRDLQEATLFLPEGHSHPLAVTGQTFATPEQDISSPVDYLFKWRDLFGLENSLPWRLRVRSQPDAPPVPDLPELPRDVAILETEVIEIRARARDDFGVNDLGLSWRFAPGSFQPVRQATTEIKVQPPSPHETQTEHAFSWNPTVFRIPADSTIELQGYARDFFPDRERSETSIHRIHVMGVERHAELLRQRIEAILAQLEEVTRLEERIAHQTGQMTGLSENELDSEQTEDRISQTQQDQEQNARQLDQLAREGLRTLRDAFRNPTLSEDTLQDWAEAVQLMQQLAQSAMPQAAGELSQARQQPSERAEFLEQAWQTQQEILEALEQLQQNVNQSLDQLQALTLAQRLRRLAAEEHEISARINQHVPETIGMLPGELPEKFMQANLTLAEHQGEVRGKSDELRGEISRFYERTQQSDYEQVSREMSEARTTEKLESIAGMISENISMQSIQQLTAWADRFNQWADQLERRDEQGGGSGEGGGDNQMAEMLIKQLMALLRLREAEANLRERTRLLEGEQADEINYAEAAQELAATQQKLLGDLSDVRQLNVLALLDPPLEDALLAMEQSAELLEKPDTSAQTRSAQTRAVEMLSDAINLIVENQGQNSEGAPSTASMNMMTMAMLLEMMALEPGQSSGAQPGQTPGPNLSGGTTDQIPGDALGDAEGRAGESRSISRTTGSSRATPGEFRDVLEQYYRAIEQEPQ